jgi:hypothetical protein
MRPRTESISRNPAGDLEGGTLFFGVGPSVSRATRPFFEFAVAGGKSTLMAGCSSKLSGGVHRPNRAPVNDHVGEPFPTGHKHPSLPSTARPPASAEVSLLGLSQRSFVRTLAPIVQTVLLSAPFRLLGACNRRNSMGMLTTVRLFEARIYVEIWPHRAFVAGNLYVRRSELRDFELIVATVSVGSSRYQTIDSQRRKTMR